MTVAERVEMLDNNLYVAYKTFFEAFGSVKVPESAQIGAWWAELEELEELEAL